MKVAGSIPSFSASAVSIAVVTYHNVLALSFQGIDIYRQQSYIHTQSLVYLFRVILS